MENGTPPMTPEPMNRKLSGPRMRCRSGPADQQRRPAHDAQRRERHHDRRQARKGDERAIGDADHGSRPQARPAMASGTLPPVPARMSAAKHPAMASTGPTDRSMPPDMMTKVMHDGDDADDRHLTEDADQIVRASGRPAAAARRLTTRCDHGERQVSAAPSKDQAARLSLARRRDAALFPTDHRPTSRHVPDLVRIVDALSAARDHDPIRSAMAITSSISEDTTSTAHPDRAEPAQNGVDLGLCADVDAHRRLVEDEDTRATVPAICRSGLSAGCRPTEMAHPRRGSGG